MNQRGSSVNFAHVDILKRRYGDHFTAKLYRAQ